MSQIEFHTANADDYWRDHPLREFHTRHFDLSEEVVVALHDCINRAVDERPIQAFLEEHPAILVQLLHASARFVLPRHRLGAEFVPDFVIGEHHSDGYDWLLVELESPRLPFFTNAGDPRASLSHAIRQIQDWRAWLQRNQNYASRLRRESGLGLTDITANVPGIVLMGRRAMVNSETNERRRQMASDLKIQIHTYDHLIEAAWASVHRV